MSLTLLLLALQAAPSETKPVVPVEQRATAKARAPKVNPTIIYTPAVKEDPPAPEPQPVAPQQAGAIGLSKASLDRVLAERKANVERQAAHRKQLAAAQEAVEKALAAEPFALDALKAALVERDRIATAYREKLTQAVLAMLDAVPADERLAVAKAVIKGELPAKAAESAPAAKPTPVGR